MKYFYTLLIVIASISAQAQTKTDDINKLLELMKVKEQMGAQMENIKMVMEKSFKGAFEAKGGTMDSAAIAKKDQYIQFITEEMENLLKDVVNNEMAPLYDRHFCQQEIKDLITFYQSETGQKMIDKLPAIQKDIMLVMTSKYMPAMQQRMMQKLEEIMK